MSDCYFKKELTEEGIELDFKVIDSRMHDLEKIIGFKFRNIRNLANAMCSIIKERPDAGKNAQEYYNSALATVGDSVIKTILSSQLFKEGLYMGEITKKKSDMENNDRFFDLSDRHDLYKYSFNRKCFFEDAPQNERLPNSKHNAFFEAIAGAIFFDSDSINAGNGCFQSSTRNSCEFV